jgi:hypothetical protein
VTGSRSAPENSRVPANMELSPRVLISIDARIKWKTSHRIENYRQRGGFPLLIQSLPEEQIAQNGPVGVNIRPAIRRDLYTRGILLKTSKSTGSSAISFRSAFRPLARSSR